jgi:serine/threonine protein kinase
MIALHTLTPPLIHRDLKSPNIFLSVHLLMVTDKYALKNSIAKIGDFGLSEIDILESLHQSRGPKG